jgi:glycosyltransferase involved in cell wall biosynthesis
MSNRMGNTPGAQTRRTNILFIIDVLWGLEGGTERHLYWLVKNLDKEQFNCMIATFDLDDSVKGIMKEEGIPIYHVKVDRIYSINTLRNIFGMRRIIKENKIDLVQTFHFMSDTYGVFIAGISGVKHIISSRRDTGDTKKRIQIWLNKLMNTRIERFITVCDGVGKRLSADEGVPKLKQTTIYNGVDFEKFDIPDKDHVIELRRKYGIPGNAFIVGMVAYFRPEKNHDIFFKAMSLNKRRIKDLVVLTVGRGETYDQCKKYCMENGLGDSAIFAGKVDNVREYVALMDVACLVPGSNEGFSNAILEKMAMGKPLVVTNVGGNAEAVINNENGIVIPPLDYQSLADAVFLLYENPSMRATMGRKSRERVEQFFSMKKMISNHEHFYKNIMNGRYNVGEKVSLPVNR